jgi:TolA-binding protein
MRNTLTIKLLAAILISSFLSGCGVLAVGGVVAGASVLADRRSPAVQAIDKTVQEQEQTIETLQNRLKTLEARLDAAGL